MISYTTTRTTGDVCGVPAPLAARVMAPESARLRGGWAKRVLVQGAFIPQTDHNWTGVSVSGGLSRS